MSTFPPIHYSDYLKVDKITELQQRRSEKFGQPAHDEMLFIVIHQVYELWFKQILFELDSAIDLFSCDKVDERQMLTINNRLGRIIEIQKILIQQVDVLETMTPMDFLEFRDYLYPASGFQSGQFRLIENKLGLEQRITYNKQDYKTSLTDKDQAQAKGSEQRTSLFALLEKWLERTPFLLDENFDFWRDYRQAVEERISDSRSKLQQAGLDAETEKKQLQNIEQMEKSFHSIFDETEYHKMQQDGAWRLSHKALAAALFIYLYRDEPILQLPFNMMQSLQTIDENFTQWRYRHALMVHRMIGIKMGTGGSSGHKYLMAASDKHKVFKDLNNLATFFIPKSSLPALPEAIIKKLGFHY
jgi:tryptophan 2,3-dioxygenase